MLNHAMILAAGLGLRMRPLTLTCPKPLISVAGRTMIDRVMDHLDEVQIQHRVVNCHWLGEQIHHHFAHHPTLQFSDEVELLETGGGVAKALPFLGNSSFFVCNADVIWTNGEKPALQRMAEFWNEQEMDVLLMIYPLDKAFGYEGSGDFFCDQTHSLERRGSHSHSPYLFTGVQILKTSLFENCPKGAFSLNYIYDRVASEGRLKGLVHDGGWYHVGTVSSLHDVHEILR
jgi:MurNAc alpha-1-phosphate uridylyltransferase